jgi:hypothetical protein
MRSFDTPTESICIDNKNWNLPAFLQTTGGEDSVATAGTSK